MSSRPLKSRIQAKLSQSPSSRWLPLHRALFYEFPAQTMAAPIIAIVRRIVGDAIGFETETPMDDTVHVHYKNVTLLIHGADGELAIERDTRADGATWDWEITTGPTEAFGRPTDFIQRLDECEFVADYREGASALGDIARKLLSAIDDRFQACIANGEIHIFGRWGNLSAAFDRVYPDQWVYLKADHGRSQDDTVLTILRADGTIIYSPFAVGHRTQHEASNLAVRECTKWLFDLINDAERRDERVFKDDLKKFAHQKWDTKQLPDRRFEACFQTAKKQAKATNSVKRGRRPKLIHRTG